MEPRNYEADAIATPPDAPAAPSNGYPTDGNPQTGQSATWPGAHWFYKVGESLRKIITDAGLTPDDADLTQLKTALVSPQSDVDAGSDDNRFVTPKKLRFGFSAQLTADGYIFFPSWMGGLVIQWGRKAFSSTDEYVTFPTPFPNQVLAAIPYDVGASIGGVGSWDSASTTTIQARFIFEANPLGMAYIAFGR